jgi:thiol-disulfide isomerase/thioredoxin
MFNLTELKQTMTTMMGGAVTSGSGSSASSSSADSGMSKYLIYGLIVIAFLGISYWAYTTYVGPLFSDFNLNIKQGSSKTENEEGGQDMSNLPTAEIYLFKADWCPHCKRALPIFNSVKDKYQNKSINGHRVIFRVVDCDTDPATAEKFNIEGYPTIKLVKGSEIVEFDAKPEEETIIQFMNTVI